MVHKKLNSMASACLTDLQSYLSSSMHSVSATLASFLVSWNTLLSDFPTTGPLSLTPQFKGHLHTQPLSLSYYYLMSACLSLY